MLQPGTKAPSFELPDQNGSLHTLEEYRAKSLYFIFIPGTIQQAAQSRHAAFRIVIHKFWKKGL